MECRIVRRDIKDCTYIHYHPICNLFHGKVIRSCKGENDMPITYHGVKGYLTSLASFQDCKVVVRDSKSFMHILDLDAGTVLMSTKMRRDVCAITRFAISEDGTTAYQIWLRGCKHELIIINLSDLSFRVFPYHSSLSHVADVVYCKEKGILVLETQVDEDRVCRNQVTSVSFENDIVHTAPLYTWSGNKSAKYFDGRYVWESGYSIHDIQTSESLWLLENSDFLLPEKHVPLNYIYYPDQNYLQVIDRNQNVFIDCKERMIIARYKSDSKEGSYGGALIGEEFWIGKTDGIYAMPFPVIEPS